MKKILLFICFTGLSSISTGQINEIGIFAGASNYVGDIGRTNYFYPSNVGVGLIYKWNWNPKIALRGTISYLPIQGNDLNADTDFKVNRRYKFKNTINEIALGIEYNFYDYDLSSSDKSSTPYILLELAAFTYNSPLEATTIDNITLTNKTGYAIPFGVGYKSKLVGKFAFAIEAKVRYTFSDDLDFSTTKFPALDFGGNGNDWYTFAGISLFYTFGRPACYTLGL